MNITLPAVVNGQIMPGGVDRYRFQALEVSDWWSRSPRAS